MRIRTIKPEFWQSENMAGASRDARLVAIALLNYADDDGIFLANERVFRGALFPFDADLDVIGAFQELSKNGFVAFAEHSGKTLGKILNFRVHQRIDKPQKSRFNAGNVVFAVIPGTFQESSKNTPGVFQESSTTEVEVEVEVEKEVEADKGSVSVARLEKIQFPKSKAERVSARRSAWLEAEGPCDFTKRPGRLQFASYCRAVHPQWTKGPMVFDDWALHGWNYKGKPIASWFQLLDSFAEAADQSEYGERLPMGEFASRMNLADGMSAKHLAHGEPL